MTHLENEENARAAQEAREAVARSSRRGRPLVEQALRTYLSAEQYREQQHDAAHANETSEKANPPR